MIAGVRAFLRKLRRLFSRTEWMVRILGLERSPGTAAERGLILVQIDGLSREELDRALRRGHMPFLAGLLVREGYQEVSLYSGLPSTTAAVQAEIFYGVRAAVPGFQILDKETGQLRTTVHPDQGDRIEKRLKEEGTALLEGGSVYASCYAGGALHARFCPAAIKVSQLLRAGNVFAVATSAVLHASVAARMVALGAVEAGLAMADAVKGVAERENLWAELMFIPQRVVTCLLLREAVAAGARADAARGTPRIQCTFLGYDEQSHRRGPSSAFAHFALIGIDRAIRSIWRAAQRSACRDYDVWIYSDHGQERARPFVGPNGATLQEAAESILARQQGEEDNPHPAADTERAAEAPLGQVSALLAPSSDPPSVVVAGKGPVAQVYHRRALSDEEKRSAARAFVAEAGIPAAAYLNSGGGVEIVHERADKPLPLGRKALDLLAGADHPFAAELDADLDRLVRHEMAGDLVLFGWRPDGGAVTFVQHNGTHGGPGPRETHGFCLLAPEVAPPLREGRYLRPSDLRAAALAFLGLAEAAPLPAPPAKAHVRVMSYNVHRCLGRDGVRSPERIAKVVARYRPDVVALQDLAPPTRPGEGLRQAEAIAERLNTAFRSAPAYRLVAEHSGGAILVRLPFDMVKAERLPGAPSRGPRGAMWAEIRAGDAAFQLLAASLGRRRQEKRAQAAAVLGKEWLEPARRSGPVVLCGEFHSMPGSRVYRETTRRLQDALAKSSARPPNRPAKMRPVRLDRIFISPDVEILRAMAPLNSLTRAASNHAPVIADLRFPRQQG